jgi:hypothetical protein
MIKFVKEFKNKSNSAINNNNELSSEAVTVPDKATKSDATTVPATTSLTTLSSTHQSSLTLDPNEDKTNNSSSFPTLSTYLKQMQEEVEKDDQEDLTTQNLSLSEPFSQSTLIEQRPDKQTRRQSITRKGTLNKEIIDSTTFD